MTSDNKKHFVLQIQEDQVDFYHQEIQKIFPNVILEIPNQEDVVYTSDLVEAAEEIADHQLGIRKIPRDRKFS